MKEFTIRPIGYVKNERNDPLVDDFWGEMVSEITLIDEIPNEALKGLENFSHIEIIFCLQELNKDKEIVYNSRPRDNKKFPKIGVFALRNRNRPNHIGTTIVKLLTRVKNKIYVQNLDAMNGTPIIDIKPIYREFMPDDEIEQPKWVSQLMRDYWEVSV